jgi:protein involved in polysaccharide export with SLBB domain
MNSKFRHRLAQLIPPSRLVAVSLCLGLTIGSVVVQAQDLPFDPSSIDQLSPEQRQRALDLMGQDGADSGSQDSDSRYANSDGNSNTNQDNFRQDYSGRMSQSLYSDGSNRRTEDNRYLLDQRSLKLDRRNYGSNNGFDDDRVTRVHDRRDQVSRDGHDAFGELKPFGYDLFTADADAFRPTTDIPIPADYVLGPGDVVRVQLFGSQNGNYRLPVDRDGRINFPKLGPIDVAGQHFDDVRSLIEDRVGREMIGVQTSVTLGELRSIRVFVLGDVNAAGSYTVSSLSTITNALIASGGIAPIGSLRKVELKRNGRVVQVLDLYDLLLHGNSSADVRLLPGDVIFIPPVGPRVSVDGEVKRPAIYELKDESTVAEMFKLAGGLLGSTNTATAQIERFDRNQKKILLQLNVQSETALDSHVQDGDVVLVKRVSGPFDNNVRAFGAVRYPGSFEWSSDTTLQSLLLEAQLLPSQTSKETYLPIGLIERTDPGSGLRDFVTFNVESVMSANAPAMPLQRNDMVIILNRKDVSFLDSLAVRRVAAGDFSRINDCAGLQRLADVVGSDRPIRLLKAFSARNASALQDRLKVSRQNGELDVDDQTTAENNPQSRSSRNGLAISHKMNSTRQTDVSQKSLSPDEVCPQLFTQVPRALPFLLEQSVAAYGEVRQPGIYPIAENTPIAQVVAAAGGLSSESDPHNVEYVSYADALKARSSHYQVLDIAGAAAMRRVNPGDVFNFKPTFLGQEIGSVRALGEFKFPGTFGILKGEHLSELMRRAGGLTASAYPFGAVFTRESARKAEAESFHRAADDLQQSMVTAVTSGALGTNAANATPLLSAVVKSLESATPVGRVVIEADPTVLEAKPQLDPILEPGDLIVMPKRPISVTVIGQVLNPGSVAFKPGLSVKQYVEQAGGYSQGADSGRVFVILPNGSAQRFKSSFWNYETNEIPPGSEIVVPRDAAPFNAMAFSERIFGLLSTLAVTAASLAVISNNN